MPDEWSTPQPGAAGEVVIVDLCTGEERCVATSRGWEVQVGANVQWGGSDDELLFNDVDPADGSAYAVQLNPQTDTKRRLGGTVYEATRDGTMLASHNLVTSRRAQPGYGVFVPDDHVPCRQGPARDDGVFVTDVAMGECRLIASMRDLYERADPSLRIDSPEEYEYHCFQTKWNPQATRLLTTLQWAPPGQGHLRRRAVVTLRPDGSEVRTAITPAQWSRGGHHVAWTPDGEHLTMNLALGADGRLDIVHLRADGSGLRSIHAPGSGHPSMHPFLPMMVTDAYPGEPIAGGDGTCPIRLIDLEAETETALFRPLLVRSPDGFKIDECRVDAHPAWDRSGRYVVFNGLHEGTRSVYVAEAPPRKAALS